VKASDLTMTCEEHGCCKLATCFSRYDHVAYVTGNQWEITSFYCADHAREQKVWTPLMHRGRESDTRAWMVYKHRLKMKED
jgi:hypothetical protein